VKQEQFEQHSLDEAGRAHAGHLGEFLSRCPGLRGQREKPVSAGMWATHNHRREHIWGQGPSTGSRPVFAVLSLALAGLAAVRDVYFSGLFQEVNPLLSPSPPSGFARLSPADRSRP